jgi:hypothetical protein
MYLLGTNSNFQQRVQAALLQTCQNISTEGWSVVFHRERAAFVNQILNPSSFASYVTQFAMMAATNLTVINDATGAPSNYVALTAGNVVAAQASITDTDLGNALAATFNAFVREPS